MADTGFLDGDPLYVLVHLKVKLRAISNAVLDSGRPRRRRSSCEEAMRLMVDGAFQEAGEADGKRIAPGRIRAAIQAWFRRSRGALRSIPP